MLIYRDTKFVERLSVPPWLRGAPDLHVREDVDGRLFGIGDGRLVGPAPDKQWADVGDGIQARMVPAFVPLLIMRKPLWCPLHRVEDQQGRSWMVPQILDESGATVTIQATYGPNWEPDYTPLQAQAIAAARWSRQSYLSEAPVKMTDACRAAAELLEAIYHINATTIAATRIMDQGLMLTIVRRAAGFMD